MNPVTVARMAKMIAEAARKKRPLNAKALARYLEVSERTIHRSLEELNQAFGIRPVYDKHYKGYMMSSQEIEKMETKFVVDDLFYLTLMREQARHFEGAEFYPSFMKLISNIQGKAKGHENLNDWNSGFHFRNHMPAKIKPRTWEAVARGTFFLHPLNLEYYSLFSKKDKTTVLHPYFMVNISSQWYVNGLSKAHGENRTFALTRIKKARVRGSEDVYLPENFDPTNIINEAVGNFWGTELVEVQLEANKNMLPVITERQFHKDQKEKTVGNKVQISFMANDINVVASLVLAWGEHIKVKKPIELLEKVKASSLKMAKMYSKGKV